MSSLKEYSRDRGSLFHNADKRKPSQPDMRGDCMIAGASYEMQCWKRNDQLEITIAPLRTDTNKYPPDAFRGALDPASKSSDDDAAWVGSVAGDEKSYSVSAFDKKGKSGPYLSLYFTAAP